MAESEEELKSLLMKVKVESENFGLKLNIQKTKITATAKLLQSCPTLCDPMDCSPPGSSIHGIFQARVLEWGAIAFSKIMASGPMTSWEIEGETVETALDFILGGSKIAAVGDCIQEIKRRLLLGRKVMTNLDRIFRSRDITFPTKIHLVKAMIFPVVT